MFAKYDDHMGTDNSVVDAARISMDKLATMFKPSQNESLINYLAYGLSGMARKDFYQRIVEIHNEDQAKEVFDEIRKIATHWTPFAHTSIKLRMSAPVPIRTQCFKHKQGMTENEESRRYISSRPVVFYPEYIREAATNVKQGSAGIHPDNGNLMAEYTEYVDEMVNLYMDWIARGVCPEQARFLLPQGVEVAWIWTGNLFSFANFYNKRSDLHAQLEIRQLAEQVNLIVKPLFPISWAALTGQ